MLINAQEAQGRQHRESAHAGSGRKRGQIKLEIWIKTMEMSTN